MIYFTLQNFYENQKLNNLFFIIQDKFPNSFKVPVKFIYTAGSFPYTYYHIRAHLCLLGKCHSCFRELVWGHNGHFMAPERCYFVNNHEKYEYFCNFFSDLFGSCSKKLYLCIRFRERNTSHEQ